MPSKDSSWRRPHLEPLRVPGRLSRHCFYFISNLQFARVGHLQSLLGEVAHNTHLIVSDRDHDTGLAQVSHLRGVSDVNVGHDTGSSLVAEERHQALDSVVKLVVAQRHRVKVEDVVEPGHHPPLEV